MKRPHIYIDTSVLGGYFDDEFAEATTRLFDALRAGKWVAIVSNVTRAELRRAPAEVRALLDALPAAGVEAVASDDESEALAEAYLLAGVVPRTMARDALHVALATCHHADILVSWNFRHLVNWSRVRAFNAVNLRLGFAMVEIRSPLEVSFDGEVQEA